MQRQSIIALGVAVALGLIAVYLANIFLGSTDNRKAEAATTRIAVAAVPLDYERDDKGRNLHRRWDSRILSSVMKLWGRLVRPHFFVV